MPTGRHRPLTCRRYVRPPPRQEVQALVEVEVASTEASRRTRSRTRPRTKASHPPPHTTSQNNLRCMRGAPRILARTS